jgi:hypothetical protein
MYSKKRLAILGILWIGVGVVMFGSAPNFAVDADPRGCSFSPCAFPAENNIGGIILSTEELIGNNLVSFGYDGGTYYDETPPGRVDPREKNVGLGISDITTGNFSIYKQWYYQDDRTGNQEPVYIWANAPSADLTSIGTTNSECGVSSSSESSGGWEEARKCDLLANVSELSSKYIFATSSCSGLFCGFVPDTFSLNNYHAVRPEDDTCAATGALAGNICLGLIKNGGSTVLGTTVTSDRIEGYDINIRGHQYRAVNGPNGQNKRLTLNDAYLEIRYGKGFDRINSPESNPDDPNGNYASAVGKNSNWGQPVKTPSGRSALGVDFPCGGGGPNTFCQIPSGRNSNREGESYDNAYGQ